MSASELQTAASSDSAVINGAAIDSPDSQDDTTVHLLPEQIVRDPNINVRVFQGDPANKRRKLEELARSIMADGQIDAIQVIRRPTKGLMPETVLIDGDRRCQAVEIANGWLRSAGKEPIRLRAEVIRVEGPLWRRAFISNEHRENNSIIDRAAAIARAREENKWSGKKGTVKVAEYLSLSQASVTQAERVVKELDEAGVKALHEGLITADMALKQLINVDKADQAEVLAEAEKIEEATAPPAKAAAKAEAPVTPFDEPVPTSTGKKGKDKQPQAAVPAPAPAPEPPAKKKKISPQSLSKAIEKTGKAKTNVTRDRRACLGFFEQLDGPEYGHIDSDIRVWARHYVEDYATGKDKKGMDCLDLFDRMVSKANRGTQAADARFEASIATGAGQKSATGRKKRSDTKSPASKPPAVKKARTAKK